MSYTFYENEMGSLISHLIIDLFIVSVRYLVYGIVSYKKSYETTGTLCIMFLLLNIRIKGLKLFEKYERCKESKYLQKPSANILTK